MRAGTACDGERERNGLVCLVIGHVGKTPRKTLSSDSYREELILVSSPVTNWQLTNSESYRKGWAGKHQQETEARQQPRLGPSSSPSTRSRIQNHKKKRIMNQNRSYKNSEKKKKEEEEPNPEQQGS